MSDPTLSDVVTELKRLRREVRALQGKREELPRLQALADELGISTRTLRRRLKSAGIPIRDAHGRPKEDGDRTTAQREPIGMGSRRREKHAICATCSGPHSVAHSQPIPAMPIDAEKLKGRLSARDHRRIFQACGFDLGRKSGTQLTGVMGPAALGEGDDGDFSVDLEQGVVHDHGPSGYGGDVLNVVQDAQGLTFQESLRWITEELSIDPEEVGGAPHEGEDSGVTSALMRERKRRKKKMERCLGALLRAEKSKPYMRPTERLIYRMCCRTIHLPDRGGDGLKAHKKEQQRRMEEVALGRGRMIGRLVGGSAALIERWWHPAAGLEAPLSGSLQAVKD